MVFLARSPGCPIRHDNHYGQTRSAEPPTAGQRRPRPASDSEGKNRLARSRETPGESYVAGRDRDSPVAVSQSRPATSYTVAARHWPRLSPSPTAQWPCRDCRCGTHVSRDPGRQRSRGPHPRQCGWHAGRSRYRSRPPGAWTRRLSGPPRRQPAAPSPPPPPAVLYYIISYHIILYYADRQNIIIYYTDRQIGR